MFTGLVECIGAVHTVQRGNRSLRLAVVPDNGEFAVARGGSVAVNGVCLSMESIRGNVLFFTAVSETLGHTTLAQIQTGDRVNLERALRLGDRLDGHIVLGHVDGVGRIAQDRTQGDSVYRTVTVPADLFGFMALKGSVAIDGVSLTIAETGGNSITVALIPHTLSHTTMGLKHPGEPVNIECDLFARYIDHQLRCRTGDDSAPLSRNREARDILSLLEEHGF